MIRPYYTMQELAEIMSMSLKGLHNALHNKQFPIPTYKLGKRRVADKEVVERFFEQKRSECMDRMADN
ncbi:helix-turn-helix domain-containing protein [Gammaproteobacteria bacterium]|nr:helix-turn-helix domain-containing protein [Gammaproteobacteria bacterium]